MSWRLWFQSWPVMKGGSGSGHHGHAGRPGKHGGSAPSKGPVSVDYLVKGRGAANFDPAMGETYRAEMIGQLVQGQVRVSDLEGVILTTAPPPGWREGPDSFEVGGRKLNGGYGRLTAMVHVHPAALMGNRSTLLHEIGHHVGGKALKSKELGVRARNVIKDLRYTDTPLSKFGLRVGSLKNEREFLADAYVARLKAPKAYGALAGVCADWGLDIDEALGGEYIVAAPERVR